LSRLREVLVEEFDRIGYALRSAEVEAPVDDGGGRDERDRDGPTADGLGQAGDPG
jgi:hypothetical protein